MYWTILLILTGLVLWRGVARLWRASDRHLPRDFDFSLYKTRELNQRGLFDKTKWS